MKETIEVSQESLDVAFVEAMTMGEVAYFEANIGKSLDEAGQAESLIGLSLIAANRLGIDLTLEEAKSIPLERVEKLLKLASASVPKHNSESFNKLMELIAGK